MNKECLAALKKYNDPKSPVYNKKIYYQWIQENFKLRDIKEAEEHLYKKLIKIKKKTWPKVPEKKKRKPEIFKNKVTARTMDLEILLEKSDIDLERIKKLNEQINEQVRELKQGRIRSILKRNK